MAKSASKRHKPTVVEDGINNLTDSLFCHILSYLTTKETMSQAFCRAGGRHSGLLCQSSTLIATNLNGYLLQMRSKVPINMIIKITGIIGTVLRLRISWPERGLFEISIMRIPSNTFASTGILMILTQSIPKHGSAPRLRLTWKCSMSSSVFPNVSPSRLLC